MKILLLSDIHLTATNPVARLDNILETGIKKFSYILNYAKDNNAVILQAGDICDTPRSWQVLSILMDLFENIKVPFYMCFGQHDLYLRSQLESTTTGILKRINHISVLDHNPTYIDFNTAVYGCSYGKEVPTPINKKDLNILVIHKEISDKLIPHLNITLGSEFLIRNNPFDLILCADIHRRFLSFDNERVICNAGPLIRAEASQEMIEHIPGFFIYETNDRKIYWETVPHEKADVVLTRTHIERASYKEAILEDFLTKIKETRTESKIVFNVKDAIMNYFKENNTEQEVIEIIERKMQNG